MATEPQTRDPPAVTHLLLLAHAPLATALLRVAEHVFPDCAAVLDAIDVLPAASPESVDKALLDHLDRLGPSQAVLILVDTFGATPANAAVRVADGQRVRVVAGLSVPMLWRTLCYRDDPIDVLVERAVAGGMQGVMQVAVPHRQHQSNVSGVSAHDQDQHSHQQ